MSDYELLTIVLMFLGIIVSILIVYINNICGYFFVIRF